MWKVYVPKKKSLEPAYIGSIRRKEQQRNDNTKIHLESWEIIGMSY